MKIKSTIEKQIPVIGQKIQALIKGQVRTCTCIQKGNQVTFIYKLQDGKYARKVMSLAAAKKVIK